MFEIGSLVDNAYQVIQLCNDTGGMGTVVLVTHRGSQTPIFALKYCKLADEESRSRFRREVRVMQRFSGNSYVMQILGANLDHDPPYFLMPYFEHGDLAHRAVNIRNDPNVLEVYFNHMIDCIAQLHTQNIFHRDIKPQNFMHSGNRMVVSDLGLATEHGSSTAFTRQSSAWGTEGYCPPEYLDGGFKDADATVDIFMLGKTFYSVLTGRNPIYLREDGVAPTLFPVIQRCCAISRSSRYQSLSSLKQSLTAAFDVILGRAVGLTSAAGLQRSITDRLATNGNFDATEVASFIEALAMLEQAEKFQVCMAATQDLFRVIAVQTDSDLTAQFIQIYQGMAREATYAWHFAEEISTNMQILFNSPEVSAEAKSEALRTAIIAAIRQNRFAAMEICKKMIASASDPELAQRIHEVLIENNCSFIRAIELSTCKAPLIQKTIERLKAEADAKTAASPGNSIF